MAPAAAQTLECYLEDTKTSPEDYDMIITGDLGEVGSKSLYDLLERNGINIRKQHNDCGLMILNAPIRMFMQAVRAADAPHRFFVQKLWTIFKTDLFKTSCLWQRVRS